MKSPVYCDSGPNADDKENTKSTTTTTTMNKKTRVCTTPPKPRPNPKCKCGIERNHEISGGNEINLVRINLIFHTRVNVNNPLNKPPTEVRSCIMEEDRQG